MSNNSAGNNSNKIALVIGSGGIKCAAAIGLWKVLKKEGINIDIMVGCSGGAACSTAFALDFDTDDIIRMTHELFSREIMKDYMVNLKASQSGKFRFDEHSGFVDDSHLNSMLEQVFGNTTFDKTSIPLEIVATDLFNGERVYLTEGKLADAVRASLAIPLIFPPKEIDGRLLIDGCVADPLPVDVAIREGAQLIIAMGFTQEYRGKLKSLTAVQTQINNIYMNSILNASFAFHNLAHHAEIFPLIPEFDQPLSMFDADKIPYIIETGEKYAEEQLPHLKQLIEYMGR